MSTLTYNNVTISLTRTLGISHEPVRADDGTYLFTAITIEVTGIVNGPPAQSQAVTDPVPVTKTVGSQPISDTMRYLRQRMLMERGLLIYDVGDSATPMIMSPPLDNGGNLMPCDANNGPLPGPLNITRVDATKTFLVTFRVVTYLQECPGFSGSVPSALISNRYSQTHSIDSNWWTTITTSGQAMFRTDVLEAAQQQADHYRDMLIAPVPKGFKRMGINIIATPGRNALSYQVTDVERAFDMGETGPAGTNTNITDIKAYYTISSTGQAGAPVSMYSMASVKIDIWGSKAASSWVMIQKAFIIAQVALPILNPNRGFLSHMMIGKDLTGRQISLSATMMISPANNNMVPGVDITELRIDDIFPALGGANPSFPSRGGTAGTYQNEALSNAWVSACAGPKKPYEGAVAGTNDTTDESIDTGPIVTATVSDELPTFSTDYSFAQVQNIFTKYKVDILYQTDPGIMMAPIAGRVSNPDSSTPPYTPTPTPTPDDGADETPDVEFLTLAKPTMMKVVEWTAQRNGASPILPPSTPVDPNLVLIGPTKIQLAEPSLMADGVSLVYTAAGRYVYGMKKVLKPTDPMPYPAPPWQSQTYGDNSLTADDFQDGIIDVASPGYISGGSS